IEYLGDADYLPAVSEFKKAIEIEPNFSKAYYKLIISLWWQNDNELNKKTEELVHDVLNHNFTSKHDKLLVEAAFSLYEHRYTDARFNYEILAELYPDDKEVWYGYGEALYHDGNNYRRQSLDAFEKAIALDESFLLGYRHIFDLYRQFEMAKRMHETAQKLIEVKPDSPIGYRVLATSTIFIGTEEEIKSTEEKAFIHSTTEDDILNLYADLMLAYTMKGNPDKSLTYYRKAMESNKSNSSPALLRLWELALGIYQRENNKNEIYAIFEQFQKSKISVSQKLNTIVNGAQRFFDNSQTRQNAHALLDAGLAMDTIRTSANLYSVAAQLALVERKYDSAVTFANQALKIQDDNQWAKNVRFSALLYANRFDEAEPYAEQKIKEDPNNASNYSDLVSVYIYSNQFNKAEPLIKTAELKDTTRSRVGTLYYQTGLAYANIQQFERSIPYLNKALDFDPENISIIDDLSRSYFGIDDYKNGERYAMKLLDIEDGQTMGYIALVRTNLIQNRYNEASLWLKKMELTNSANLRMHSYYYLMLKKYDSAYYYADLAYKLDQRFFSINLLASVLVNGDLDIERGMELARFAKKSPLAYNHFDIYVSESPFVPLPDQTIALAYFKNGEYLNAKKHYDIAFKLRPDDKALQDELQNTIDKLKS
ncbi:MAG: hypothetical protein DWP97_13255, partial [Calditrichaeota bacterium]